MDPQFIPTTKDFKNTLNVLEYLMTTIMDHQGPPQIVHDLNNAYAFVNAVLAHEPPDEIVL